MIPWAARHIHAEDVAAFEVIKELVNLLPNDTPSDKMSCHVLARAIADIVPDMKVCDGYLLYRYRHSWLETRWGNIIDVYPVAQMGGPLLLDGGLHSPWLHIYTKLPQAGGLWWDGEVDVPTLTATIATLKSLEEDK